MVGREGEEQLFSVFQEVLPWTSTSFSIDSLPFAVSIGLVFFAGLKIYRYLRKAARHLTVPFAVPI